MNSAWDDVERVFRLWLSLSEDRELLALLALVQQSLKSRGWQVTVEIAGPVAQRA